MIETEVTLEALPVLRAFTGVNCVPSPESVAELKQADIILLSGQFVGAGKSTFSRALEQQGRVNVASWTNRNLRPGEVEGVDKVKSSLSAMAEKAIGGYFLELEEVRSECFYATPAAFTKGQKYVKDLELKGAMRLRSFAPDLPIIVPLPPVRPAALGQVTEWERRVIEREHYQQSL